MLYRSHRGGVYDTPENTMPAFINALKLGYDHIETDPQLTRDGVVVLIHDSSINRTCRYPDGTRIEKTVLVKDITYDELMKYDAGIAWGEGFKGTKVPRLDELLEAAEGKNVSIALDKKIGTDNIELLTDIVKRFDTRVSFSTSDIHRIERIQSRIVNARFDYDVDLEDEALREVVRAVRPEDLIIWMYLDKPNFSWLADKAKVSRENYDRVRGYGRVTGIANICTPTDVFEALSYKPDIIEL